MKHKRYLKIYWPDCQELMEIEGFEEHSALDTSEEECGPAYFVEESWFRKVHTSSEKKEEAEEQIILPSRYSDVKSTLELVNKGTHKYKLITNSAFISVGMPNGPDGEIIFIDLEGGPYISVGSKLGDKTVTKIEHSKFYKSYLITLCD